MFSYKYFFKQDIFGTTKKKLMKTFAGDCLSYLEGTTAEFKTEVLLEFERLSENDWVICPQEEVNCIRNHAFDTLKKLDDTFFKLWNEKKRPLKLFWLCFNDFSSGFESYELGPILTRWFCVKKITSCQVDSTHTVVFALAELRQDIFGLSITLSCPLESMNKEMRRLTHQAYKKSIPIVGVFLSYVTFQELVQAKKYLYEWLAILKANHIALGLFFEQAVTKAAPIDHLKQFIREFNDNNSLTPITLIYFEEKDFFNKNPRLFAELSTLGISIDCSHLVVENSATENTAFSSPYLGSLCYFPMQFDSRIPAGLVSPNIASIAQFPRLNAELFYQIDAGSPSLMLKKNLWRADPDDTAKLMDIHRISQYFNEDDKTPEYAQKFHEYRIYNRPTFSPAKRHTLLHTTIHYNKVNEKSFFTELAKHIKRGGYGYQCSSSKDFWKESLAEAAAYSFQNISQVIQQQISEHEYLDTISNSSPLREDILEFVRFLPEQLGATIELGAGYGQLANALREKSDFYVCVELNDNTFLSIKEKNKIACSAADVHQLPFKTNCFNSVIANNILEHVYDPVKCLKEIYRVLLPEGGLYALIPLDALDSRFNLPTHLWKADLQSIELALKQASLEIVTLEAMDIYQLGVRGAFPTCKGLVAKLYARKPGELICAV